jgi:hypothetical protein
VPRNPDKEPANLASEPQTAASGRLSLQAGVVLAVGLAFAVGVILKQAPLNGFPTLIHWLWPWRDLPVFKTAVILLAPLMIIGWVLWRMENDEGFGSSSEAKPPRAEPWGLLCLLALSNFLLQLLAMVAAPRGIKLVGDIVRSPRATSYFTDATKIQGLVDWLRTFHQAHLGFHSSTHPPGPVLFYYVFVKLFGPNAAQIGGYAVGLIGSLGVLLIYRFAGLWTNDRKARLTASAFYALVPALTLFFPEFDQCYPVLAMLLIFFWVKALNTSRPVSIPAVYLGLVLFTTTFFAYNVLTVGAFLAYYGLYWLCLERATGLSRWGTLLGTCGIALGVFVALHAILWQATGFEAIASFRRARAAQAFYAVMLNRPYAAAALVDPYDFFLGAGMMALPLLILRLRRSMPDRALTLIAVATILTVDLTGFLRGETARLWLFCQPLLAVPVALELSSYRWRWRIAIFATQWWVLVCLKSRMFFVGP